MPAIAERGATTDSLLKSAVTNFNNKKFAEAIPAFETILKDSSQNAFVQYYYGIALLQNNNIEKARIQLTALYYGGSIFKNDAAFYIALSYLKEKNIVVCKDWLNKIPTDNATWFKAKELLKKL
jgi:tetratricopeptide (TPR) repeat protein